MWLFGHIAFVLQPLQYARPYVDCSAHRDRYITTMCHRLGSVSMKTVASEVPISCPILWIRASFFLSPTKPPQLRLEHRGGLPQVQCLPMRRRGGADIGRQCSNYFVEALPKAVDETPRWQAVGGARPARTAWPPAPCGLVQPAPARSTMTFVTPKSGSTSLPIDPIRGYTLNESSAGRCANRIHPHRPPIAAAGTDEMIMPLVDC
jgi:hypothetical protein